MFGKLAKCWPKFSFSLPARQPGRLREGVSTHIVNVNWWIEFLGFETLYPFQRVPGVPLRSKKDRGLWPSAAAPDPHPSCSPPTSVTPLTPHSRPPSRPSHPATPPFTLRVPFLVFQARSERVCPSFLWHGRGGCESGDPWGHGKGGRERPVCVETVTWWGLPVMAGPAGTRCTAATSLGMGGRGDRWPGRSPGAGALLAPGKPG